MAVRTKGRRKIIVENTLYLWYISLDKDKSILYVQYCV